ITKLVCITRTKTTTHCVRSDAQKTRARFVGVMFTEDLNMKKALSILLVSLVASSIAEAGSEVKRCSDRWSKGGKIFTLSISPSFKDESVFKLCKREKPEKSFIVFEDEKSIQTKEISGSEYDDLYALYDKALEYNLKDSAMGLDGSNWCLETDRGFAYSKACFWSPSYDTEKRGLQGLYKLGTTLLEVQKNEFKK
ncbi:hypothetical protein, partial [Arenicella xantha]